jgi:N utilization substance protein B
VIDRYKARRLALQGLCALDVQGKLALDLVMHFIGESNDSYDVILEGRRMLTEVLRLQTRIDALLAGDSRHWDLTRMALVDRNILRLAVWEMLEEQTPRKVTITEALRLAKEFASAESSRFVNGVLDTAMRQLAKETTKPSEPETKGT